MPAPKGNKFAIGNSGKPKMFDSVEDLQAQIDQYYLECKEGEIPLTIEGLCEVLECDRLTLLNYEKKKGYEEFFNTIKKAKTKITRNKVERALSGKANPAFTIFDLCNNTDYENTQKVDHSNKGGKFENNIDLSNLTYEEIKRLKEDNNQSSE